MTMIKFPAETAWSNLYSYTNKFGDSWWNNGNNVGYTTESMSNRIKRGIVYPGSSRIPLLTKQSNIFAIGSCFARRIEGSLLARGMNCLSEPSGVSNKYNTYAIVQELKWALDKKSEFPDEAIVRSRTDDFLDLHIHIHGSAYENGCSSLREMKCLHEKTVTSAFRNISKCNIIIITLGLVEAWLDNQTNLYVNDTPHPDIVKKYPGRFSFELLDYFTNISNLESIYSILCKYCPNDLKIFVTVSPVPLSATFTLQRDVLVANTLSKSVLRVVAEEWAWRHPEKVYYFPSYEMVMNSRRELVWEDDQVHVKSEFANHIVDYFWDLYGQE